MAMPLENHAFEPQFYSRRNPSASPFWKIVAAHYDEFERVYPERYGAKNTVFTGQPCGLQRISSLRARLKINWVFAGGDSGLIIMVRKRRISEDI
jgi:hypothetical protein